MTQHILCPTDGSYQAQHAADCAVDLAKSTGATVTFLTVDMRPQDRVRRRSFWRSDIGASADAQVAAQLNVAAEIAKDRAFNQFECVVAAGSNAADAIVAFADAHQCDHIVMGTGITSEFQRLILGSVAADVVSHAHCPVTVVH
ncbi:MAG: universal stress protein [Proteobacteria bacterium]|nr:universal stress protein [Pseudomonadota bacterium]